MDGEILKNQAKANYTEAFNFIKEKINEMEDGDDDDESKPTTSKEEIVELKMVLSNISSIDERILFEDIKTTVKKIYESKNIILKDDDISITKKESKTRKMNENDSIELEITIKVPEKNSKEEMDKIMKETSDSEIKEELLKVNPSIYENIGVKVEINNTSNSGNRNCLMLLFTLLTILLVLN